MPELTLEEEITAWREQLTRAESIDHSAATELEYHLRDAIEAEIEGGATPEEAFKKATTSLGDTTQLDPEFHKVHGCVSWAKRLLWMAAGFSMIKLSFLLIDLGTRLTESLWLRWFPGVTVKLPHPITVDYNSIYFAGLSEQTLGQIHVAVLAKSAFIVVASTLFILLAARCIRGRSTSFNRWFADATPWKSISLTAIIPLAVASPILFLLSHRIPKAITNQQHLRDIDLYGMTEAAHNSLSSYTGYLLSHILAPVLIGFTIWAIVVTRRQTGHRFISWMLGGYLVAGAVFPLLSITGMLSGSAVIHFAKGFAESKFILFESTAFRCGSGAAATCLLTQMLFAASLLIFAQIISRGANLTRFERVCKFLSKNAIIIVLILNTLPRVLGIIGSFNPEFIARLASWIYLGLLEQEGIGAEVLQSSLIHPYHIEPWLILGIAAIAGHSLLRERLGKSKVLEQLPPDSASR